jgi:hypothetical protein
MLKKPLDNMDPICKEYSSRKDVCVSLKDLEESFYNESLDEYQSPETLAKFTIINSSLFDACFCFSLNLILATSLIMVVFLASLYIAYGFMFILDVFGF